ncbi:hypothetical protein Naga_100341g3 [Nannochloropsis gaditana]|uniref:Uncharacterized protein n=1 Tax=Nannochloropsis gaditana TaxID=72520 RepID=W7TQ48_9STRA|nr:hypothetical protein Naga_100341g3 [Nannochloropsis gaditana]
MKAVAREETRRGKAEGVGPRVARMLRGGRFGTRRAPGCKGLTDDKGRRLRDARGGAAAAAATALLLVCGRGQKRRMSDGRTWRASRGTEDPEMGRTPPSTTGGKWKEIRMGRRLRF